MSIEVTVAVLNHRRPHLLSRVLTGVLQLDYPTFEIVVVGDRSRLADLHLPERLARAVRYFPCAEANISRARNIAVEAAAGEVVAFCDDDAVPEPDWLTRLAAPFAMHDLGAAGGLVRGADGLAEWQGAVFDRAGTERPLAGSAPIEIHAAARQLARGRFLALRGVNSAFRRAALHAVGGFDEAYRYYLDETDMALRLAEAGWSAALVRGAEVQHQPEANVARGRLRQPRDLFDVAASKAHFCRRHLPADRVDAALAAFRAVRLRELDPYLRLGLLRMADRDRLARRLEEGTDAGLSRAPVLPLPATPSPRAFAACEEVGGMRLALVTGWGPLRIARLRSVARRLAEAGHAVSCFSYLAGPHPAEVTFRDGVWLHRGGTWRFDGQAGQAFGRAARARAEIARLATRRCFDAVLRPAGGGSADGPATVQVPGLRAPLLVESMPGRSVDAAAVAAELRRLLAADGSAAAARVGAIRPAAAAAHRGAAAAQGAAAAGFTGALPGGPAA